MMPWATSLKSHVGRASVREHTPVQIRPLEPLAFRFTSLYFFLQLEEFPT